MLWIDRSSFDDGVHDGIRKAWFKDTYRTPVRVGNIVGVHATLAKAHANCRAHSTSTVYAVFYDGVGNVLGKSDSPTPVYQKPAPASTAAHLLNALCEPVSGGYK